MGADEKVAETIYTEVRKEASASPAPALTGGIVVLAAAKRSSFDEPPLAVRTDPLR